jgi:hypothetical protein
MTVMAGFGSIELSSPGARPGRTLSPMASNTARRVLLRGDPRLRQPSLRSYRPPRSLRPLRRAPRHTAALKLRGAGRRRPRDDRRPTASGKPTSASSPGATLARWASSRPACLFRWPSSSENGPPSLAWAACAFSTAFGAAPIPRSPLPRPRVRPPAPLARSRATWVLAASFDDTLVLD